MQAVARLEALGDGAALGDARLDGGRNVLDGGRVLDRDFRQHLVIVEGVLGRVAALRVEGHHVDLVRLFQGGAGGVGQLVLGAGGTGGEGQRGDGRGAKRSGHDPSPRGMRRGDGRYSTRVRPIPPRRFAVQ